MKVQDGCDNRCTYCIVPYVRGGSRSRSIAFVVEHVQRKVRAGYKEVVLTGIHLGDYHPDGDETRDGGPGACHVPAANSIVKIVCAMRFSATAALCVLPAGGRQGCVVQDADLPPLQGDDPLLGERL